MPACRATSLETQGQILGRGKVGTGNKKIGRRKVKVLPLDLQDSFAFLVNTSLKSVFNTV